MKFYVGLHQPADARYFDCAFISISRLRKRRIPVPCGDWILDSGAFSEISRHGDYRFEPKEYADHVNRLVGINPGLQVVVSQDWMCEPHMLKKTGLSIDEHQWRTISRYDNLLRLIRTVYLMPVLQGYQVEDYLRHVEIYADYLNTGAYVGVGTLCKRNINVDVIEDILLAIKAARPDLLLHGFGLKTMALQSPIVRDCLYSADSMAWSFAARYEGRDANDWREARAFAARINGL